jgi:uncharacterized protein (DUF58 family)
MLPVPTRRLAVVVAASAIVVVLAPFGAVTAWLGVVVAIAVLAIVDFALAPAPATVRVERHAPAVVARDDNAEITWTVGTQSSRRSAGAPRVATPPVTIAVADELAPSLQASRRRFRVRVPADRDVVVRAAIRPSRRGLFVPREVVVRTEGPLGLLARQRRRDLPGAIRVLPAFASRAEAELRIDQARVLEVGLRSAQGRGGGTDFDQLREYSVDDEFRRLDWAATARAAEPIVRTYRAERNQTVLNLLDNGRVMARSVAGIPRVEHAMDAAMTLTTVATRLGDRCGLVVFDRAVRAVVPPSHTRGQLGRVTDALFDLEPELSESDYRAAFEETRLRFRRRTLVVIHTDLVVHAVVESLVPALPLLTRRHLVIVAAAQDPAVIEWATATIDDAGAAYRRAAALDALDERRRAADGLRALGVTVIDAPPDRLALELADTYLRFKATNRL